jgi:hypothetical protein
VVDDVAKVRFKSLCRSYDAYSVKTLGNWVTNENLDKATRTEAMKLLFMYGHKKPGRGKAQKKEHSGTINVVLRHITEGKPPGEK